jgi:hypothetical protein
MRVKFITFFIFLFFVTILVSAQKKDTAKSPLTIGIRTHYGFIIKHSTKLGDETVGRRPWIIEADFGWHLTGQNVWKYCFCYPRAGFTLYYVNFDNPEVIGSSFALPFYIEPYMKAEKKLSYSIRFGGGPAYMTQIYDTINNPENVMFSSRISFVVFLNIGLNYRLNPRTTIRLAANYNHISNGGIKNPNLGANFPTANIGIDYSLSPTIFPQREKDKTIQVIEKKNMFRAGVFFSASTPDRNQQQEVIVGSNFYYSRKISRLSALSMGLEIVHNGASKIQITNDPEYDNNTDYKRGSVLVGHDLIMGRFIFNQLLGVYIYAPYPAKQTVYERIGLFYKINKNLYTGISLKTHLENADFLDARFGLAF